MGNTGLSWERYGYRLEADTLERSNGFGHPRIYSSDMHSLSMSRRSGTSCPMKMYTFCYVWLAGKWYHLPLEGKERMHENSWRFYIQITNDHNKFDEKNFIHNACKLKLDWKIHREGLCLISMVKTDKGVAVKIVSLWLRELQMYVRYHTLRKRSTAII